MEEKRIGLQRKHPPAGEDLSDRTKEILAEIDREDMDEMDRRPRTPWALTGWIHVDFTLDYDTALEGSSWRPGCCWNPSGAYRPWPLAL